MYEQFHGRFGNFGRNEKNGYIVLDDGGNSYIYRVLLFVGNSSNYQLLFVTYSYFVAKLSKTGADIVYTFTNTHFYIKLDYPFMSVVWWSAASNKLRAYYSATAPNAT